MIVDNRLKHRLAASVTVGLTIVAYSAVVGAFPARAYDDAAPAARSPADEQATFQLADRELTTELVAAEPDVVSPVAICWDADGAMYVAEMRDYPLGPASGTIRRLVDRDRDGRYETATLFAEKLSFPNGLLAIGAGLLVTATPDLLLLVDSDGDGIADERRVVFTGFGEGNQQLRANGLQWGLDNWIYGANGRSDGVIRRPDEPAERGIAIRTRDFRFRPDFSRFEAVTGQSQFGQVRDDWGNRFLSWNTIPIRQQMFAEADLARNPQLARWAINNLADPGDAGEVFPIAPRPQTFNRESTNHYNALAGLTIYRGDKLGENYYGDAFAGESLCGLVHRRKLVPHGPSFVSRRVEQGREFLAAADSWFHPVFLTTGPDGCLYVVDFYRRWVEHPQFVAGQWREKVAWREGDAHGRIWRVRRRGAYQPREPRLTRASTGEIVGHLADRNGWWRDTAQRVLVERGDKAAVPALTKCAGDADPLVAVGALWALEGLGALATRSIRAALEHPSAAVRQQGVSLAAAHWPAEPELRDACLRLANDPDIGVRFRLPRVLSGLSGPEKLPALAALCDTADADGWLARAISGCAADVAHAFIAALVSSKSQWLVTPSPAQIETLEQLGERFAPADGSPITGELLELLFDKPHKQVQPGQLAILAGAAAAQRDRAHLSPNDVERRQTADSALEERLRVVVDVVLTCALDDTGDPTCRILALSILRDIGSANDVGRLAPLASEGGPIADAAVTAICRRGDANVVQALLDGWPSSTPSRRRLLSTAALESPAASRAFIEALERQPERAVEIDPALRTAFGKIRDQELAARAERIFAKAAPAPREEVLAKYRAALDLAANREHGAALFKAHCLTCHVMFGLGRQAGPDLSGIAARPKETLLSDLLDPSRQVAPDYLSYSLVTRDGRALAGILVSDTEEAVTLRRGEGADDIVLKRDIDELVAAGKSLMPEGFEQRLSVQDVTDVLGFLGLPERRLLEQP